MAELSCVLVKGTTIAILSLFLVRVDYNCLRGFDWVHRKSLLTINTCGLIAQLLNHFLGLWVLYFGQNIPEIPPRGKPSKIGPLIEYVNVSYT